jgi:hypothetical protein
MKISSEPRATTRLSAVEAAITHSRLNRPDVVAVSGVLLRRWVLAGSGG